ncbi:MAG: DUF3800 domain-containing protein [Coriobacteriales bacterium]|jgi:hypothetical protein|nr:DUF3800 domain-containing protein [Coriobacteriales bacterium]
MRELSAFADESGDSSIQSKYYLLTLVFHDQVDNIAPNIVKHEHALKAAGLPDVPFHMSPLLNGHHDYEHLTLNQRRQLLVKFFTFVKLAPIRYKTFAYQKSEISPDKLVVKMKQDIINYLFQNIAYFQQFDTVKVYYDRGQQLITNNLTAAMNYVLAKNVSEFKDGSSAYYRLAQAADLFCGFELTALKFDAHEQTTTDEIFFINARNFKLNYLRKLRAKLLP